MFLGVDLGGTKTEIIMLDQKTNEEIYRERVVSPRDDYAATIATIKQLVEQAKSACDQSVSSVGIGIPGTVSVKTGNVKNANSTWLNGHPLAKDAAEALGLPVAVDNDANCFAVSEASDGAATGEEVVFGVIIGTGCGAGLSVNGKAHIGPNGLGGEWGHNPLPMPRLYAAEARQLQENAAGQRQDILSSIYAHKPMPMLYTEVEVENEFPGHACYCGKFGCLETWISGTGFENDFYRHSGERLKSPDIVTLAEEGHYLAQRVLALYTDRLARGLAHVVNIVDPDAIVLGGGMGNIKSLYDDLPELVSLYAFTDHLDVKILPPAHGDSSGVRGAAWLGRGAAE